MLLSKPIAISAALVVALLCAALGWQTIRLSDARTELAEARRDWERMTVAALRRAASDTARWQRDATTAEERLYAARQTIAARDADVRRLLTDNDGLRNSLAVFAAGPGDDSLAACRTRAAKLADLLGEGAELVAEGKRLVEERDAEVAALLAAWPKNE